MFMKKIKSLVLVFFLCFAIISCKKTFVNEEITSTVSKQTISNLKGWYQSKLAFNSKNFFSLPNQGSPDWGNIVKLKHEGHYIVPINTPSKRKLIKYLELNPNDVNSRYGKFVYIIPENGIIETKQTDLMYENIKNETSLKSNFTGLIVEYDLQNNLITEKYFDRGENLTAKDNSIKSCQIKGINLINKSNSKQISDYAKCTAWYYYLTLFYSDGTSTTTSTYLFTTCDTEGQTINSGLGDDGGSGSGGSSSPNYQTEFNQYILTNSTTATLSTNSIAGNSPIIGTLPWTVVKGQVASWRVEAFLTYGYNHYEFYNSLSNTYEQSYDLYNYSSTAGSFIGSNTFISTTWSGTALSQVFNNNSSNAAGHTVVNGVLTHISNIGIPNPLGGNPITLNVSVTAAGGVMFNPK